MPRHSCNRAPISSRSRCERSAPSVKTSCSSSKPPTISMRWDSIGTPSRAGSCSHQDKPADEYGYSCSAPGVLPPSRASACRVQLRGRRSSLATMVSYDDREVTAMAQQGQVFPLAAQGRDGTRWAYRYRVGGRGSRRVQRGGFASEQAAAARERTLEQLRREQGLLEVPTLAEFVQVYLAQHEGEPETTEKLRWL